MDLSELKSRTASSYDAYKTSIYALRNTLSDTHNKFVQLFGASDWFCIKSTYAVVHDSELMIEIEVAPIATKLNINTWRKIKDTRINWDTLCHQCPISLLG